MHTMSPPFRLFLAALFLLSFSGPLLAADAEITWTHPTQNTDNSAIPATGAGSIASTRIEWGTCAGTAFGTKAGDVVVPAPGAKTTVTGFAAGTTACFRAYSKNTYGVESAASGVASKVFPPPTPKPPVLGAIAVVVWETKIHPTQGLVAGRKVGTVAIGAKCYGDENGAPLVGVDGYRVTLASVKLTKTPRSELLIARCAASS